MLGPPPPFNDMKLDSRTVAVKYMSPRISRFIKLLTLDMIRLLCGFDTLIIVPPIGDY